MKNSALLAEFLPWTNNLASAEEQMRVIERMVSRAAIAMVAFMMMRSVMAMNHERAE